MKALLNRIREYFRQRARLNAIEIHAYAFTHAPKQPITCNCCLLAQVLGQVVYCLPNPELRPGPRYDCMFVCTNCMPILRNGEVPHILLHELV